MASRYILRAIRISPRCSAVSTGGLGASATCGEDVRVPSSIAFVPAGGMLCENATAAPKPAAKIMDQGW